MSNKEQLDTAFVIQQREKVNRRCRLWRERHPERAREVGRAYRERSAEKEKRRAQLYREGHLEEDKKRKQLWIEQHREQYLKECRKRAHTFRKKYPEKVKERQAVYIEANRERLAPVAAERSRQWYKMNPERAHTNVRNRKARLRGAEGKHSAADVRVLLNKQNGKCAGCRQELVFKGPNKFHVDHKHPVILGGSNSAPNLQLLCRACNLRKHAMPYEKWLNKPERVALLKAA